MVLVTALGVCNVKLKGKLIINYLLATLLTLFFVGFAVLKGIERLSISTIEQQLIDQSELAEIYISQIHIFQSENSEELSSQTANNIISKLGLVLGNVHIYDKNLNLQASSKIILESSITDLENQKVLDAALKGNYAYIIKNNIVYFASPIYFEDSTIGILEIIYPMSFFENLISRFTNILLIGAGIFTILMTLLIANIAERVTKPINQLAVAASNYANRNFIPVEIKSSDEISQLYKSFNTMGIQLQDYIQRQKQFVANVSHELRTPLTAIKGYSEYLMDEVKDRPDLQKAVYHLNNESNRLAKLVDEVLTLSRIDSSKENFQFNQLNFSDIINDTIEKMSLRAQKYGIRIVSNIEPAIYIWGDSEKLIQVIVNLLDNAFKFSPSQSTVWVDLYKVAKTAFFSVTDQGIGIPQEDIIKVFDRFYRAGNTQGISGTGLGLPIVKFIIDEHKGTIELTAAAEKGTTVIIKLPIQL